MKKVTIADVAESSGMSVYAVSRALSGKSGVSDESRQYITKIATQLGYISKHKEENSVELIRLVIPSGDLGAGEHYMSVLAGAEMQAKEMNVKLDVVTMSQLAETVPEQLSGYIFAGELEGLQYDDILGLDIPSIALFYLPLGTPIDNIMFSDHEIGGLACRHLTDLGHKHLAVVRDKGTKYSAPSMKTRVEGFHIEANNCSGVLSQSLHMDDVQLLKQRIQEMHISGTLPTAFFCVNDFLAERLIALFTELKIKVPYDVSVIGFGNYTIAQSILPPLTTIQAPMREMGQVAVQQLLAKTRQTSSIQSATRTSLTVDMIYRATTAPPRMKDAS